MNSVPIWHLGRALRDAGWRDAPSYPELLDAAKTGRISARKEPAPGGGMRWAVPETDLETVAAALGLSRVTVDA